VSALADTPDVVAALPEGLLLNGVWVPASGGATLPVENPATGETLAHVADGTPQDAMAMLDAAVAAQPAWAATPPRERAELLRAAFEAVRDRREQLATLISL
jgi:succinate-semialdehyde dehydrogenase/glutarate-semialdehyde dehydrogenase